VLEKFDGDSSSHFSLEKYPSSFPSGTSLLLSRRKKGGYEMAGDRYDYATRAEWIEGKKVRLVVEGQPDLEVSTPSEFGGPKGFLSPEELFVASACTCYLTTFFAVAEGAKLRYKDIICTARGIVEKVEGKGFRFTQVNLYPELAITGDEEEEWAERVLKMSKKNCLVVNSMTSEVKLYPKITVNKD
jgi:peroxiredoxin-like protein